MGDEAKELIEAEKVSIKDMYDRISKCRDFEISNVWTRAVFLTAFLLGCFTAYGFVIAKFHKCREGFVFSAHINWTAFVVTLIAMGVSSIWIMMAKGSKAWYEIYEDVIDNFVSVFPRGFDSGNDSCSDEEKLLYECKLKELRKILEDDPKWKHLGFHAKKTSLSLWSSDGGTYSPSRINILIGQMSLVVWGLLAFIHTVLAFVDMGAEKCFAFICNIVHWMREYNCFLMLFILFFAVVLLFRVLPKWVATRNERQT